MLLENYGRIQSANDVQVYVVTYDESGSYEIDRMYFNTSYDPYPDPYYGPNYHGFFVSVGTDDTAEDFYQYQQDIGEYQLSNGGLTLLQTGNYPFDYINILSRWSRYQNNTNSDITIKSIGLTYSDSQYLDAEYTLIVARKVLDEPLIIHPNEIYKFSYIVRIKT